MIKTNFSELSQSAKGNLKQFLKKLCCKGVVSFADTDFYQLPRGRLVAFIILLLGNFKVEFRSNESSRIFYWYEIFPLALVLLIEWLLIPYVYLRHASILAHLERNPRPQPSGKLSESSKQLLYLRTDLLGQTRDGGSFTHVAGVIGGAVHLGWTVNLVASGLLKSAAHTTRVIKYTPFVNWSMEMGEMAYSNRLFKKLKKENTYHAVYQRHSGFNLTGLLLARQFNIPLILEVNNLEVWIRKNWGTIKYGGLLKRTEQILFKEADRIIVVSQVLKDDLVKFGVAENKILVNPNGVDEEIFTPTDKGRTELREKLGFKSSHTLVGFIGSFGVWHGVNVLADAIQPALKENPQLRFMLIGDGDLRSEIESKLKAKIKAGEVLFTGRIRHTDAPSYLSACDMFVSPHIPNADGSKFFGSPTKLFEYMAMERPLIASNLDQIGDILEDRETAVLVEPGSAPDLAKAIVDLAKNPDLGVKIARQARKEVIDKYTWTKNAQHALDDFSS